MTYPYGTPGRWRSRSEKNWWTLAVAAVVGLWIAIGVVLPIIATAVYR